MTRRSRAIGVICIRRAAWVIPTMAALSRHHVLERLPAGVSAPSVSSTWSMAREQQLEQRRSVQLALAVAELGLCARHLVVPIQGSYLPRADQRMMPASIWFARSKSTLATRSYTFRKKLPRGASLKFLAMHTNGSSSTKHARMILVSSAIAPNRL